MLEERITELVKNRYQKRVEEASDKELYEALLCYTKEELSRFPRIEGEKKLYYISAEFLI